jgi:putative transposase
VHLIRNSMRYASWKDRKVIAAALRPIYAAATVDAAAQALDHFAASEVGRRCPAVVDVWRRAWTELVPFLDLPAEIRRVVYTTNAIESINFQLRKVSKTRGQFPSDDAVYKILYLAVCDIETRDKSRGGKPKKGSILSRGSTTHGWTAALNQLEILFPGRLPAQI